MYLNIEQNIINLSKSNSYRFHYFKFRVSPSQIAVTSSLMMSGPQFTRPQSTGFSGLGALLESYHRQT